MNAYSFRLLKGSPTNWGYILILIIFTILVAVGILGYSRYVINEIVSLSQFPEIEKFQGKTANWKVYKGEEFSMKYPPDWEIKTEKTINLTYLTQKEKRIPEDIWVFAKVIKKEDLQILPFYDPLNFFGKPVPIPVKVKIGEKEFYKSEEGFEAIRDIRYAIANEDESKIGWITLSIRYGRQRMDYYLPDEKLGPELETFNQVLSTFRFLE